MDELVLYLKDLRDNENKLKNFNLEKINENNVSRETYDYYYTEYLIIRERVLLIEEILDYIKNLGYEINW